MTRASLQGGCRWWGPSTSPLALLRERDARLPVQRAVDDGRSHEGDPVSVHCRALRPRDCFFHQSVPRRLQQKREARAQGGRPRCEQLNAERYLDTCSDIAGLRKRPRISRTRGRHRAGEPPRDVAAGRNRRRPPVDRLAREGRWECPHRCVTFGPSSASAAVDRVTVVTVTPPDVHDTHANRPRRGSTSPGVGFVHDAGGHSFSAASCNAIPMAPVLVGELRGSHRAGTNSSCTTRRRCRFAPERWNGWKPSFAGGTPSGASCPPHDFIPLCRRAASSLPSPTAS